MPKLSIICPAYNAEKTISVAIESVINQDWDDFELIVIDDGSTDSTLSIVNQYALDDNRIKPVHRTNGGQAEARSHGLSLATGEWILFLDSDDSYQPGSFRKLLELASIESPDVLLFGFNIYSNHRLLRTPNGGYVKFQGDDIKAFKKIMGLMPSACNKLYRRDYIKVTFDKSVVHGEDSRFNYQNLVPGTTIISIPDCLYNVCLDTEGSVNKRYKKGRLFDTSFNFLLQLEVVSKVFTNKSEELLRTVYNEGVDRMATCLIQSQSKLSKQDCIDEIRQSKTLISQINRFKPNHIEARVDKKLLWTAFSCFRTFAIYQLARFINVIVYTAKWIRNRE